MGIQNYEDQIGWGPFVQGIEFDGDHLSMGMNFMGMVCPGGQEVGDQKSRDQIGLGPNALQPHKSKKSEQFGRCSRQNKLQP